MFEKKEVKVEKEEVLFHIDTEQKIPDLPPLTNKETMDLKYPLIPPYAYAHIYWDKEAKEIMYAIEEPVLDLREKGILTLLEEGIRELINITFISVKEGNTLIQFLERNIKVLLTELGISITKETFMKLMYYIYRDFVGLNEIEPLLCDYFIEDIECNGTKFPLYIVHRKYRNLRTNIVFEEVPKLARFVEKVAQKCGKYVSYSNPLLDGSLPDGSLDYNEPFIYKENKIVKISKIGEFIDRHYIINESNTPIKIENIEVPAFDPKTLKIIWRKVDYAYRHKINEDIFEVNLEFGRKVRLTGCHSLFVLTKNGVESRRTDELTEEDYAIIPLIIPENDVIKEINVIEEISKTKYAKKFVLDNVPEHIYLEKKQEIKNYLNKNYKHPHQAYYEMRNKRILPIYLYNILEEDILRECKIRPTSAVGIPTFLKVDENLMKFLGLYIAEGWLYNNTSHASGVYFSLNKKEKDLINTLNKSAKECFGLNIYIEPEDKNAVKIKISSYALWVLLNEIIKISKGAKDKRIPELVLNVNKKLQQEFLKYWSLGDYGSSASKYLANDISYLSLFNKDVAAFYDREKVALFEGIRKVKSHEYYTNFFVRDCFNSYSSMIPTLPFNPLKETHNIFRNKRVNRERFRSVLNNIKYQRFKNLRNVDSTKFIKEWSKRGFINEGKLSYKGNELLKEIEVVNKLIDSDLGFAKINSIKKVKSSSGFVYDVSVKDCENFIGGYGGICCHNSRVQATYTVDITSRGPSFSIRKFTKEPWSPTKYIQMRTASPELLAYLWMLIEHEFNVMVIGGTGSGKTSLLNALAFFIPPQARIVSIEDSVTGDSKLIIKEKNRLRNITIKEFVDNKIDAEVMTLNEKGKVIFTKPSDYIKHKVKKDIYEIITSTGRKIKVTQDHSIFTLNNFKLKEIKPTELIENKSFIAVPRTLPIEGREIKEINLIEHLKDFKDYFLSGDAIKTIFEKYTYKQMKVKKQRYIWWKKNSIIKIKNFIKLNFKFSYDELKTLRIKSKNTASIPVIFEINKDFLEFLGLWLGDGSYDNHNKNSVIISNIDKECRDLVYKIARYLGSNTSLMDDGGVSIRIHNSVFYNFMKKILEFDGYSHNKKIPGFIFNLSNEQTKNFIRGYFSADGTIKPSEASCTSRSYGLLEDLQSMFLRLGIISRISDKNKKDKCISLSISSYENKQKFLDIGFLQKRKNFKLKGVIVNKPHHTVSDIIPLSIPEMNRLNELTNRLSWPYLVGKQNIGRDFLQNIAPTGSEFNDISHNDILWDKVRKVRKLPSKLIEVFDLSIPKYEKFLCNNIFVHNTRELNLEHDNWLPSVAREGIGLANIVGQKYGEVSLFDLLKESFRQNPDYVIVGEVRGAEAYVLFQGMASIPGNQKVMILDNGNPRLIEIDKIKNIKNCKTISYTTKKGEAKLLPIVAHIKHPKRSKLIRIKTKTGREIITTPDHSLFTLSLNGLIDIPASDLKIGNKLAIASKIPCGYMDLKKLNLIDIIPNIRIYAPEKIKEASQRLGYYQASKVCGIASISDYYSNFKRANPSSMSKDKFFSLIKRADLKVDNSNLQVKLLRKSRPINAEIEITDEFLRLLGYYISEGTINFSGKNSSLALYNKNEIILEDMKHCINKVTNAFIRERTTYGFGTATELKIGNKIYTELLALLCGRGKNKKIPEFIFGLSKERIGQFLSGLFTGDGYITHQSCGYTTVLKELAQQVQQLLLVYGIVASLYNNKSKRTYETRFYREGDKEEFVKYVKLLGRKEFLRKTKTENKNKFNEVYLDTIKELEIINLNEAISVYDLCVPGPQNFLSSNGVILHNSGHPSFGTMHADDVKTLIRRLETPPINLSPALVESMDAVCVMSHVKVKGLPARRIREVVEVVSVKDELGEAVTNQMFAWNPTTDNFSANQKSNVFTKLAQQAGLPLDQLYKELKLRAQLLAKMTQANIFEFRQVQKIINEYNTNQAAVLQRFNVK